MRHFNVQFQVNCITELGQVAYICGNIAQLGNWQPCSGLRLFTDPSIYPKWNPFKTIHVKQGETLVFKLCIVKDHVSVRWENIQGNRQIIPNQHIHLQFTADHPYMYAIPAPQLIAKQPRKNIYEILNDMQSDGSSSKEYWKQYIQDQQEVMPYITFTNNMRKLIESQAKFLYHNKQLFNFNQQLKDNQFNVQSNQNLRKCHFYNITEQFQNSQLISMLGHNTYCIGSDDLQRYVIHNNSVPIVFHIQNQQKQKNQKSFICSSLMNIRKIISTQNLLMGQRIFKIQYYLSISTQIQLNENQIDQIIKCRATLVIFNHQNLLNNFVEKIKKLGFYYSIISDSEIQVQLSYSGMLILKVSQRGKNQTNCQSQSMSNRIDTNQSSQIKQNYYNQIKKTILYYLTLDNPKVIHNIFRKKNNNNIISLRSLRKINIIFSVSKLQLINEKILKQLIYLSGRQRVQVYILIEENFPVLEKNISFTKNQKILIISLKGAILGSNKTYIDIFQNLCLQKQKFKENISKINQSLKFGIKLFEENEINFIYDFHGGQIGQMAMKVIKEKIKNINKQSLFKIEWQEKGRRMKVYPFCISQKFFYRSLCQPFLNYTQQQNCLILNFNCKSDTGSFLENKKMFTALFNNKENINIENYQVTYKDNQIDSFETGLYSQQMINIEQVFEKLEHMNEQFSIGSGIKQLQNQVYTPSKNARRSLVDVFQAIQLKNNSDFLLQ